MEVDGTLTNETGEGRKSVIGFLATRRDSTLGFDPLPLDDPMVEFQLRVRGRSRRYRPVVPDRIGDSDQLVRVWGPTCGDMIKPCA